MDLCDIMSILHRDISHNNIMLYTPKLESDSSPETRHRGLLINYDYSMKLNADASVVNQKVVGHHMVRLQTPEYTKSPLTP